MINRRNLLMGTGAAIFTQEFSSLGAASAAESTPEALSAQGFVHPEWLIDVESLAALLAKKQSKMLAIQKPEEFEESHIAGAQLVRYDQTDLDDTSESSVAVWRASILDLVAGLGINHDDSLVVYDGGSFHAARLWWLLDQVGFQGMRILNGGLPAWTEAGNPVESGAVASPQSLTEPNGDVAFNEAGVATIDEVIQALEGGKAHFVDARHAEDFHNGHIPGAVSVPIEMNAAETGPKFWKSADDLSVVYQSIPKDALVIPYCAGGVRSAVTYFTLLQIGYQNVSLFTGSWNEWAAHPELPVEVG